MGEKLDEVLFDPVNRELLDLYQRDFPVCSRPFTEIARRLHISEAEVIERIARLCEAQVISRLGPVFHHARAGASLLAALAVPPEQLDAVAEQVNRYAEVNHNYEREHRFNLWFVVTAPDEEHLHQVLDRIQDEFGLPLLRLPMEQGYHVDLAFKINWSEPHASLG